MKHERHFTPSAATAKATMMQRLGDLEPHEIRFNTDAVDLDETAEHLQSVLAAVADYIDIVLFHIDDNASEPAIGPCKRLDLAERLRHALPRPADYAFPVDIRDCLADVPDALADVTSDAVAACQNAADIARGYYA
jgi:hypothetical protein